MKEKKRAWNFIDLIGQVFDRLTVIKYAYRKHGKSYWSCTCNCGSEKQIFASTGDLKKGHTKSCGCLVIEVSTKLNTSHGLSHTRLYSIFYGMLQRCSDLNNKDYGGRNIKVCERWLNLEIFINDVQDSYLQHVEEFGEDNTSLDRINSNGNYEPNNIKWSTKKEQSRNTRISTKTNFYNEHRNVRRKLQVALNHLMRNILKTSKYEKYFGGDLIVLKQHLQSQFIKDMTWDNYGKGSGKWNIDHIVGCNNFDLSIEENIYKCFNYKNLRPMWHEDHVKKSKHLVNA